MSSKSKSKAGQAGAKPHSRAPPQSGKNKRVADKAAEGDGRKLKRYCADGSGEVPITVGLTGARAGDLLRGVGEASGGDTKHVLLRIDTGEVRAPVVVRKIVEESVGREAVIAAFAKHFGLSKAVAEMRYNDCPTDPDAPNHRPLGQGQHCTHSYEDACDCDIAGRFTILSQGAWQEFADAHGKGDELRAMVSDRRSVTWRDVLRLMYTPGQPGGKTLILRPRLFEVVCAPVPLEAGDPRMATAIDAVLPRRPATSSAAPGAGPVVLDLDGQVVRVPAGASQPFSIRQVAEAAAEALRDLIPDADLALSEASPSLVSRCIESLQPLTAGGLKSCMQKMVRFRAETVALSEHLVVPTPMVVAVCCGLLFANRGTFSPELQLFTRGGTAAFKRTAVILLEDAWVVEGPAEGPGACGEAAHAVCAMMGLALAMQRMPEYEPPRPAVVATMRWIARASVSPHLIAWRDPKAAKTLEVAVSAAEQAALEQAAEMLRLVRSFECDMKMFETVASLARKTGKLPLQRQGAGSSMQSVVPIWHLVDQHSYRGLGHVARGGGATFKARFEAVFANVTGINPRRVPVDGFEDRPEVKAVRFAQRCVARFALRSPAPRQLARVEACPVELVLQTDPGVLAAAVGPVKVKIGGGKGKKDGGGREVLVMLGTQTPEDEVVMLPPARATRDLYGTLTEAERAEAVRLLRAVPSLPAVSPVLPPGAPHAASFQCGEWHLDGRRWQDVVEEGQMMAVPLVEAPQWAQGGEVNAEVLRDKAALDAAVEDALAVRGTGVVAGAREVVRGLAMCARGPVALRALAMLRRQYAAVAMPTPALDGGLASDQLAAYAKDWDAYRLLVLLSRVAPAALQPAMPPTFRVPDARLLRVVEQWMAEAVRRTAAARPPARAVPSKQPHSADPLEGSTGWEGSVWGAHPKWGRMGAAEERLMEHQKAAVSRMHARDDHADIAGHFLILDTGAGKTLTSLVYAFRWLKRYGGEQVRRILWVTPAGTVENLVKQLGKQWEVPVFNVPRVSAGKASAGDVVLKDYAVNVIHADHLRTALERGLAAAAPACFLVFDEVDEMYAPTLRTSAARALAHLCPKFVAQTATPMRRNEQQLLQWLADTCAFPVDHRNMLVAASCMVSIQLELGVSSKEELELVPMTDRVRSACLALAHSRSWLDMAKAVREGTDEAMVGFAIRMAKEDRKQYPNGGVLLVADSLSHGDRLIQECSRASGGVFRVGGFETLEAPDTDSYGIVVVTKDKDRGYNSAVRLGVMVTGAYAGNSASRHQMRGRLRRLGQRRKEVRFVTVVMENSILHLLHHRHSSVDSMNISLEQLGQKFSADVLKGLSA